MVEILCSEMARAFAETGTPLPPWRQHAAMLSKWSPRRSEEVDVTAAMNNGVGRLLPPMPGPGGALPNGVAAAGGNNAKRLTGPSTVAQRLMMLGVVQQQSAPSPIAEGVEHLCSDNDSGSAGWEAVGGGASTSASSASSLHLDWDDGGSSGVPEEPHAVPQRGGAAAAAAALLQQQHQPLPPRFPGAGQPMAMPQRTASDSHAIPAGPAGHRGKAILEGIRTAAAALPHRRNNTWC